jgi:Arc/MetJ-type ribon-helix-helix transcriptional regulator
MNRRMTIRTTDEMISRLDAVIASQPAYVSPQELVRQCVEFALQRAECF